MTSLAIPPGSNELFDAFPWGIGENGIDGMQNKTFGRAESFYRELDFVTDPIGIIGSEAEGIGTAYESHASGEFFGLLQGQAVLDGVGELEDIDAGVG